MGPTVKVPSGRRLATLPGIRKFAQRGAHERRFLPPVGNRAVGVGKRPWYGSALLRAPVPVCTGGQGKTRRGYRMPGAAGAARHAPQPARIVRPHASVVPGPVRAGAHSATRAGQPRIGVGGDFFPNPRLFLFLF